jgi:hypothetical protein
MRRPPEPSPGGLSLMAVELVRVVSAWVELATNTTKHFVSNARMRMKR